jgi:hypothetical protein
MSTRDLIDAIAAGDSVAIQSAFDATMATRISDRLDVMQQDVARNMFNSPVAEQSAEAAPQPEGQE